MARPRNHNKRRTPSRAVTNLFPEHVKWYAGEIRFLQRPTQRQIRMVAEAIGDWASGPVGVDGAMMHVGKWPEDIYEGPFFLAGLQRAKVPMRYRIAPRGRERLARRGAPLPIHAIPIGAEVAQIVPPRDNSKIPTCGTSKSTRPSPTLRRRTLDIWRPSCMREALSQ